MKETEKFILGKSLSKNSKNENMSLNLNLSGNKRMLPDASIDTIVNAHDVYLNERANSNKFRITISINPYCSNILFNPFTEIVKYYKSGDETKIFLMPNTDTITGYSSNDLEDMGVLSKASVVGKRYNNYGEPNNGEFQWNAYKAIRDTQLSNDKCGFEYYCGVDIFNNHILRSKTHKPVTFSSEYSEKVITNISNIYRNACGKPEYNTCAYYDVLTAIDDSAYQFVYDIDEYFNTIDDYMRDRNGVIISDYLRRVEEEYVKEASTPLHLYQSYDIRTFDQTLDSKLLEKNGWFGFLNDSLLNTSSISYGTNIDNDINKVINSRGSGEFIDMYPTRDLFSFSPLYNKHRKRLEKNWNYYLTYPSGSITEMFTGQDFPFFHTIDYKGKKTISLKVFMIDEYSVSDDGRDTVTIYTICQHGLVVGDKINLYVEKQTQDGTEDTLFYEASEVVQVYNKYIFRILKTEGNISNKWIDVSTVEGNSVTLSDGRTLTIKDYYIEDENGRKYPIAVDESDRCNVDESVLDISFKRVVNNVECEYYVREFTLLPNFKFADSIINDETLYGDSSEELNLIENYSQKEKTFESHVSDESFAKTSYGDANTEIVYTDDIDISFLRDNLGRPVSDIFLTVIKNNKGYKDWYGIGGDVNINEESIEMSHCFGKNNCGFILSDNYRKFKEYSTIDARDITVLKHGLLYAQQDDEIDDETNRYYGDICCYSPLDCDEQSIQSVHNRFNTAQRELYKYGNYNGFYGGNLYRDEIKDDENGILVVMPEDNKFNIHRAYNGSKDDPYRKTKYRHSTYSAHLMDGDDMPYYDGLTSQDEGYFHKTHYKIKLKTVSETLNSVEPISFEIYKIFNKDGLLNIKTRESNYLEINDKLILYVKSINEFYYLTVKNIIDEKYFECVAENENYEECYVSDEYIGDIEDISLLKKPEDIPYYARIVKDGSCRYYWRNILSNGIESNDSKIYPFTNGAFYINKRINFYLRRQDPFEYGGYYVNESKPLWYVPKGRIVDVEKLDDYYEASEIEDCNIDLKELLNV